MRPDEMENNRYKQDDHCRIEMEELAMLDMLEKYRASLGKQAAEMKVIDLGCGSGLITRRIQEMGYKVTGLDFSEEAVSKAKANGIDAYQCNLDEGIKGENGEFDVVWAGDIVEHVFDPMGLLREANRVLKSKGVLIVSIPSDVGLNNRLRMLFGISYQEQMYRRSGFYKHHTFFTLHLMDYMLEQAQLIRMATQKILIVPPNKRFKVNFLPSMLYNEVILTAQKK